MQAAPSPGNVQAPPLLLNGRYRLLSKIGEGGFSAVYKVEDTGLSNALRSVKEMRWQGADPQEARQVIDAFQQEARLLATLNHPNLPRVYDHFEQAGRWYLVMDLIEGQTLATCLEEAPKKKLSFQRVLPLARQLCSVLSYLHNRQPPVIFRDLKPSNIMVTEEDHLYLIDFGIARLFKPGKQKDTMIMGSPGYAAPEQYGRGQTTEQTDIYGLGATLHHLLSGRDPGEEPFKFPVLNLPHMGHAGPEMAKLVERMLALDVQKRPATILEVRQELQKIAELSTKAQAVPSKKPAAGDKTTTVAKSPSKKDDQQWQTFEEMERKQEVITAKVTHVNKGGLVVYVQGVRGFVPRSQVVSPAKRMVTDEELDARIGGTIRCKITSVERAKGQLILSERGVPKSSSGGEHAGSTVADKKVPTNVAFTVQPAPVTQAAQSEDKDERSQLGNEAEEYALQIIKARSEVTFLRGPMMIFPSGGFKELDFLVYTGGTLFCIEVKNWLGTVSYAPRYRTTMGQRGPQQIIDGFDYTKMVHQRRAGKNGEPGAIREYKNLLEKTKLFISDLKEYVGRVEPRFRTLMIIPVVAFTHRAEISAVQNFQAGIISLAELQDFFNYSIRLYNPLGMPPMQWISDIIQYRIPKWDLMLTAKNSLVHGVLRGTCLFTDTDGRDYSLPPYSTIRSIVWQKTVVPSYIGRSVYEMTVRYINGAVQVYNCLGGKVYLSPIPGDLPQEYDIQQLQHLIVGIANKG